MNLKIILIGNKSIENKVITLFDAIKGTHIYIGAHALLLFWVLVQILWAPILHLLPSNRAAGSWSCYNWEPYSAPHPVGRNPRLSPDSEEQTVKKIFRKHKNMRAVLVIIIVNLLPVLSAKYNFSMRIGECIAYSVDP